MINATSLDEHIHQDQERALAMRKNPNWTKPIWWRRYRRLFLKRRLKKCVSLLGIQPASGTICPTKEHTDWYMCMFGAVKSCEATSGPIPGLEGYSGIGLGDVHPTTRCTCKNQIWTCEDWNICSPSCLYGCFSGAAPPSSPATSAPSKASIGSVVVVSSPNDLNVTAHDVCPATNPLDSPSLGTDAVCSKDLECVYGSMTCCGNTYDIVSCICRQGEGFACLINDACLAGCLTNPPSSAKGLNTVTNSPVFMDPPIPGTFSPSRESSGVVPVFVDPPIPGTFSPSRESSGVAAVATNDVNTTIYVCPATNPLDTPSLGTDVVCSKDLECKYGSISCCGNTYDIVSCICRQGGGFACLINEACLVPCPTFSPSTAEAARDYFS